jgi:hypothetical protein
LINGALRWGVASEIRRLEAQLLPSSSSATPSAPPLPATVVETPDWFCIGCVGPRGAGKSTLLSLLRDAAMSGDAAAAAEAEALRIKLATQVPPLQSDERRPARVERVVRQATTAGVDVSVVPGSRLLLLEARPIDDVSLRSSGAAAPRRVALKQLKSQGDARGRGNGLPPGARIGQGRGAPARRSVARSRSDNFTFPIST